jgi:hypothetical protein
MFFNKSKLEVRLACLRVRVDLLGNLLADAT